MASTSNTRAELTIGIGNMCIMTRKAATASTSEMHEYHEGGRRERKTSAAERHVSLSLLD